MPDPDCISESGRFTSDLLVITKTFKIRLTLLSTKPTKWSNILKNCLSLFDHFVGLVLKGLNLCSKEFFPFFPTFPSSKIVFLVQVLPVPKRIIDTIQKIYKTIQKYLQRYLKKFEYN